MPASMDEIVEAELRRRGAPVVEENKRIVTIQWMLLISDSPLSDWPLELRGRELEFVMWSSKYYPR